MLVSCLYLAYFTVLTCSPTDLSSLQLKRENKAHAWNRCSQARFPTAGQGERGSGNETGRDRRTSTRFSPVMRRGLFGFSLTAELRSPWPAVGKRELLDPFSSQRAHDSSDLKQLCLIQHRMSAIHGLPIVAASAPVAERSVKLKGLMTHRFHKAQVYWVNSYSDPVK